jgi:hypothetical protein
LGCSFSNGVFSIYGTNVLGGLCSFGASTELIKKVSEMFVFLNLTLHSFGPKNFVPLVQITKFQKSLKEKNEWCITHNQHAILVGKKYKLMHQPNT